MKNNKICKEVIAVLIMAMVVSILAAVPAQAGPPVNGVPDHNSVYSYAINWAVQSGANEVSVKVQAEYCDYCDPNTGNYAGCAAFTHTGWCGGAASGRYIAVRLKDSGGSVLATQKYVMNQGNWPIGSIRSTTLVFSGLPVSAGETITVEADTYCGWCGHYYPAPRTLTIQGSNTNTLYTGATSGQVGSSVGVSAVLTETSGTIPVPLAGKQICFTLDGLTPVCAMTDLTGVATTTLSIPLSMAGGTYTMDTRFAGDASYFPSSDSDTFLVTTNQPPVAGANGPYTDNEGSMITFDASSSYDPDAGDSIVLYEWDLDDDGVYEVSSATPTTTNAWYDDYSGNIGLRVTDAHGATDTNSTTVIVNNVDPAVSPITAPVDPVAVGTPITASASFTDPGTLDSHKEVYDWGDGSISAMNGHTYTIPGVYTITLTVTDDDGGVGSSVYLYAVVYDPNAGFVTGGGWINSTSGAYLDPACTSSCPDPTGRANFGFVSKYQKGATTPTGETQFQFKAGDLNFHSDSYQWLVIAGANAKYKGTGTINGAGNYGFMLTATDSNINGGGLVDTFRIKIWDMDNSDFVVYDNQRGLPDDDYSGTDLEGGSIHIHTKK